MWEGWLFLIALGVCFAYPPVIPFFIVILLIIAIQNRG